jgi:hypothetical protein
VKGGVKEAELLVGEFDRVHGGSLTPLGRSVAARERSTGDHVFQPVGAGDRYACRRRIDAYEASRPQLDLVAVDPHRPAAFDDEVDLLELRVGVIVLSALRVGREDEVVDAERLRPGRAAHLSDHPAWAFALELAHVDDVESHEDEA